MVVHGLHHVEPRVAARLADAEHEVEVSALLLYGKGVLDVGGGAQRAGDVQVHMPVVGLPGARLHAAQAVLIDGHLRHAVAAQLCAARQVDDLRVLGGYQLCEVFAVGVQRDVDGQLRVVLDKQLGGTERIVNQRLTAENLQVFVLEALAAGTATNGNEQTIHCTFSPKVSFSTFSASAGGLQLSPQPVSA